MVHIFVTSHTIYLKERLTKVDGCTPFRTSAISMIEIRNFDVLLLTYNLTIYSYNNNNIMIMMSLLCCDVRTVRSAYTRTAYSTRRRRAYVVCTVLLLLYCTLYCTVQVPVRYSMCGSAFWPTIDAAPPEAAGSTLHTHRA